MKGMEVVQEFKKKIEPVWYQPTTDAEAWREFAENMYTVDYTTATVETLKHIAWECQKITSGADEGMWEERAARLRKFLAGDMGLSESYSVGAVAIQYDFVACFLDRYKRAAHNEDLWRAFNESAVLILHKNIEPQGLDENSLPVSPQEPAWTMSAIALILFSAFKTVNLSYYRPTEDTRTWECFQAIMFDLSLLSKFTFLHRHAYLLSTVSSTVDEGIWETMSEAASKFLNANLGKTPATAREEFELAIRFCEILEFNFRRAAHNEDLFEAYYVAFAKAKDKLRIYMEEHT